jgi:hypothetical protein
VKKYARRLPESSRSGRSAVAASTSASSRGMAGGRDTCARLVLPQSRSEDLIEFLSSSALVRGRCSRAAARTRRASVPTSTRSPIGRRGSRSHRDCAQTRAARDGVVHRISMRR